MAGRQGRYMTTYCSLSEIIPESDMKNLWRVYSRITVDKLQPGTRIGLMFGDHRMYEVITKQEQRVCFYGQFDPANSTAFTVSLMPEFKGMIDIAVSCISYLRSDGKSYLPYDAWKSSRLSIRNKKKIEDETTDFFQYRAANPVQLDNTGVFPSAHLEGTSQLEKEIEAEIDKIRDMFPDRCVSGRYLVHKTLIARTTQYRDAIERKISASCFKTGSKRAQKRSSLARQSKRSVIGIIGLSVGSSSLPVIDPNVREELSREEVSNDFSSLSFYGSLLSSEDVDDSTSDVMSFGEQVSNQCQSASSEYSLFDSTDSFQHKDEKRYSDVTAFDMQISRLLMEVFGLSEEAANSRET
jgi:hypothetical protein